MICGNGTATCCSPTIQRRLTCLEQSLGELLERFDQLLADLTEEELTESEPQSEEEEDLDPDRETLELKRSETQMF